MELAPIVQETPRWSFSTLLQVTVVRETCVALILIQGSLARCPFGSFSACALMFPPVFLDLGSSLVSAFVVLVRVLVALFVLLVCVCSWGWRIGINFGGVLVCLGPRPDCVAGRWIIPGPGSSFLAQTGCLTGFGCVCVVVALCVVTPAPSRVPPVAVVWGIWVTLPPGFLDRQWTLSAGSGSAIGGSICGPRLPEVPKIAPTQSARGLGAMHFLYVI